MELKWLEDFLMLLEEKSVSRSALRRHVTQPAFSRRIKQLESWLGVELLDRSTKPVSLRQTSLLIEATVRDLVFRHYALRSTANESQDRITIVTQHTLAISHFPALLRQIKGQWPKISYQVVTANYDECETLFYNKADMLLCYQSLHHKFQFEDHVALRLPLGSEQVIPVASKKLAAQLGLLTHGMTLPLLTYQPGSFLAEMLANSCLPNVIRDYRVDVVCESTFSSTLKEMMLDDMGIAWLAREIVKKELESGSVVSFESILGAVELEVILYYRNESLTGKIGAMVAASLNGGRF